MKIALLSSEIDRLNFILDGTKRKLSENLEGRKSLQGEFAKVYQ